MNKKKGNMVNIGTTSLLVIFIVLCLTILSTLTLASALNDRKLSEKYKTRTTAYYTASNEANRRIAGFQQTTDSETLAFRVPIDDTQELNVSLVFNSDNTYTIKNWNVIATKSWESDERLNLIQTNK